MILIRHTFLVLLGSIVATATSSSGQIQPIVSRPAIEQRREIIRGQVTTDSGVAIAGAQVLSTRAPDRAVKSAETQTDGRYEIVWEEGGGDYLVHISAVGRKTFRQRVTRTGGDSVFVVNAKLVSSVQRIAPVTVEAKAKLTRVGNAYGPETGAAEKLLDGVTSAVPLDAIGDLYAAAATIPGVSQVPGGISVLGLSAAQNSTTLNGIELTGANVPADVRTRTRVTTTTYDPARGWFSGANVNVELAPAGLFSALRSHATIDAPILQSNDRISSRLGQRYTNVQVGLGGEGPIDGGDRFFYNFGVQGSRRVSRAVSLLDADPNLLEHGGIAADSVSRLVNILNTANVPLSAADVPSSRVSENLSMLIRADRAPYDWKTFSPARRTWGLTAYGKLAHSKAVELSPSVLTTIATQGGRSYQQIGSLQAMYSFYFGNDWLQDLRSSFTATRDRRVPFLRLPDGRVLVTSEFENGAGGRAELRFGGNATQESDVRHWTWETTSETQFYPRGRAKHRVKLNADSRLDGFAENAPGNRFGTFTYNSLGDLEANRPASFTRTLDGSGRAGGVWNGFVAIGDLWRVSPSFQILYGARIEANAFTARPAYNPEVERTFGARTDHAPNTVHLSPRFGFTWNRSGGGPGIRESQIGVFNMGPTSYIRGGIGEFRNMLRPSLLSDAAALTGLSGDSRRLTCIGAAVPIPDWGAFVSDPDAIAQQCLGGAPALVDAAPGVELFDREFTAPRSWRTNLAYSSTLKKLSYTLEGTYSLNLNQPGIEDLNFLAVPRFTLVDEGRPVFVSSQSIVASTGVVSPVEARRTPSFGRVTSNRSDLRSVSRQATVTLMPDITKVGRGWHLGLSYTLSSARAATRGFGGTTFGDPTRREWARGDLDARHQFLLQAGYVVKGVGVSLFGRATSGLPLTPMVGSDVNGDGLANDRAFIFDPANVSDPVFASEMRRLNASLPSKMRKCVEKQQGMAAERNSCEGPWTAAINAQMSIGGDQFNLPRLTNIAINFANPLGGLDQLLHGSSRLRGWGSPAFPNPVLYNVLGFDSTAGRYKYEVNPRFGSTLPSQTTFRAPFRVTLQVSISLGSDVAHQQLDRWLRPGRNGQRGQKLSADELKRRYERSVPNPYTSILRESDSLLLSREQADAITQADARLRQRMDSLWMELAVLFASLPDKYDVKDAFRRQEAATEAAWEIAWREARTTLPTILSPIQLRLLPITLKTFVEMETPPKGWRNYRLGS